MKVILASTSPRRLALLQQLGWEAVVRPTAFAEAAEVRALQQLGAGLPFLEPYRTGSGAFKPEALAVYNARGKGLAAVADLTQAEAQTLPVLAADTIVVHKGHILGKPGSKAEAAAMLQELSGDWHQVLTGVAVFFAGREALAVEATSVHFRSLTQQELEAYLATGEPMDKAGAYGIQGKGTLLVDRLEGVYDNVVGLPLTRLYKIMAGIGVKFGDIYN